MKNAFCNCQAASVCQAVRDHRTDVFTEPTVDCHKNVTLGIVAGPPGHSRAGSVIWQIVFSHPQLLISSS